MPNKPFSAYAHAQFCQPVTQHTSSAQPQALSSQHTPAQAILPLPAQCMLSLQLLTSRKSSICIAHHSTMPVFPKCCCCDLKVGNVVLGCLCLFGAVLGIGNSIKEIVAGRTCSSAEYQSLGLGVLCQNGLLNEEVYNANLVSSAIYLVLCLLYIPACICLIVGAKKDISKLVAVFLFIDATNIFLVLLKMIVIFALFGFDLSVLIVCLIAATILILIWLFPFSLWQQLRDEDTGYMPAATKSREVLAPVLKQSKADVSRSRPHEGQALQSQNIPAGNEEEYFKVYKNPTGTSLTINGMTFK